MIVASLSLSSVEHMIHILVLLVKRVNGVPRGSRNKRVGNITVFHPLGPSTYVNI